MLWGTREAQPRPRCLFLVHEERLVGYQNPTERTMELAGLRITDAPAVQEHRSAGARRAHGHQRCPVVGDPPQHAIPDRGLRARRTWRCDLRAAPLVDLAAIDAATPWAFDLLLDGPREVGHLVP